MERSDTGAEDAQLAAYRCLLDNARAMLKAAREERWEDLPAMDAERQDCFSRVMQNGLVSTRPSDAVAQVELIQNILECDEQTKALIKAWQTEMAEVLGFIDNSRKLADAYGGS